MSRHSLFRSLLLALLASWSTAHAGCAEDEVLSVGAACGDGVRQPEEECDVKSDGCVQCKEAVGWHCRDNVCTEVCGDGKIVGGETCDPPDGKACDTSCHKHVAKEAACDMTGAWAVHQTDYSVASVGVGGLQTSSNWYYIDAKQTGTTWEVTRAVFCGINVSGAVNVKLSDPAQKALQYRNKMDASSPGGAHTGVFMEQGDGCYFEASRQYYVRGGKDALLPPDFHANPDLASLTPLPKVNDFYDLSKGGGNLELAEDTDNDGFPGVAYIISGLVSGTRNAIQRDWASYQSDDNNKIAKFAPEFTARSDFRNQENILHVECASGGKCPLLEAGSTASLDTPGHVAFRYLGKTWNEDPMQTLIVAEPGMDPDKDFASCANIKAAMPHETGKK